MIAYYLAGMILFLETGKPLDDYQKLYEEIKGELATLEIPFQKKVRRSNYSTMGQI